MDVKQVATILNSVFDEVIGESDAITEDLNNIVDVGRTITAGLTTATNADFENYIKAIVDKVGKTIYNDKSYTASTLGLVRDGWEYGSVLEKIRVDVGEYEESKEWDLANYDPDVFSFNPPSAEAKYFNKKTTFTLKNSVTKKQFMSAFTSASTMSRFFAAVENRIRMKQEMAKKQLEKRTLNNFIAEKLKVNSNVVNILAGYKALYPSSTTDASNWMLDKDFLTYAYVTMKRVRGMMKEPSILYNVDGYVTFTDDSDIRMFMLEDLASAFDTTLYAQTFHEEYVKMTGFHTIPYWQSTGVDGIDYAERSKINVIPASEGEASGDSDTRKIINQDGILAVFIDKDSCMVCNEDPEVTSIWNPEGKFFNYWYSFDCSYFNDLDENGVIFIVSDYEILVDQPSDWASSSSSYYTKGNDGSYSAVSGSPDFAPNKFYKKIV